MEKVKVEFETTKNVQEALETAIMVSMLECADGNTVLVKIGKIGLKTLLKDFTKFDIHEMQRVTAIIGGPAAVKRFNDLHYDND